jgi:hypothetical protein
VTINQELFKKIHEQIAANPEHHDQRTYEEDVDQAVLTLRNFAEDGDNLAMEVHHATHRNDGAPVCGTTRCVAGWALYLTKPDQPMHLTAIEAIEAKGWQRGYSDMYDGARALLGLSTFQADELFDGNLPEQHAVSLVAFYAGIEEAA